MKKAFFRIATCVAIGLFGMMTTANATPFTLINGSGAASGNTGAPVGTGPAGGNLLSNFGVGGIVGTGLIMTTDHLAREDFYLADGSGAVVKLTDLPVLGEVITPSSVTATYGGTGYEVNLHLALVTPNMLSERLVIRATSDVQNLRIWEYTDYDVAGTAGGDTATLINPSHIRQTDGLAYAEVIVHGPTPDAWQIGAFSVVRSDILAGLDLNNTDTGPLPGDNEFAFEWIIPFLAPGEAFTIDKWKNYGEVPEPGTLGLMALAGLALGAVRMRKRLG